MADLHIAIVVIRVRFSVLAPRKVKPIDGDGNCLENSRAQALVVRPHYLPPYGSVAELAQQWPFKPTYVSSNLT